MADEWNEIQVLPEGVFRVLYKKMSMRTIRSMHTRLRNNVVTLHNKQTSLMRQHSAVTEKILNVENQLGTLRTFLLEHDPKFQATVKAEEFLRQYLGDDAYQRFTDTGTHVFEDKEGATYKIDLDGRLHKKTGNGYTHLCIAHKPKLPLGDRIVSIITSIKENPEKYQGYVGRRRR